MQKHRPAPAALPISPHRGASVIEGASGAFFSLYTTSELGTILRYLQEGRSGQEASMARVQMLRMILAVLDD